jgi:hypothetical protein
MFICVSKSSTHTNRGKNANNAHKYDCSSPKKEKKEQTTTKKKKVKKWVNVT